MVTKTKVRQPAMLALNNFIDQLEQHVWFFDTDSYFAYIQAIKEEQVLFATAMSFSQPGLDEYRWAQNRALRVRENAAADMEAVRLHKTLDDNTAYYRKEIEKLRAKFMKPIDFFLEKLEKHDWYYNFSDDGGVYRSGAAREKALEEEAKASGPEFVKAFNDAHEAVSNQIRTGGKAKTAPAPAPVPAATALATAAAFPFQTSPKPWYETTPKETLENWKAEAIYGAPAPGLVGRIIVHGWNLSGSTTQVVAVRTDLNLVRTLSGSVYKLGKPEPEFGAANPVLLLEAGVVWATE